MSYEYHVTHSFDIILSYIVVYYYVLHNCIVFLIHNIISIYMSEYYLSYIIVYYHVLHNCIVLVIYNIIHIYNWILFVIYNSILSRITQLYCISNRYSNCISERCSDQVGIWCHMNAMSLGILGILGMLILGVRIRWEPDVISV